MSDPTTVIDIAWQAAGVGGDAPARALVEADLPRLHALATLVHGVADAVELEPGLVFQCPPRATGAGGGAL